MSDAAKIDLDRLIELAGAGAAQAAEAFSQLVGETVSAGEPVVQERHPEGEPAASLDPNATGVFFAFEGCLEALVGILFPGAASESLVRRIVGIETGALEDPIIESALMEVGNILASHVASAIADRLASRLLPSIPSLAMADAEFEFESFVAGAVGREAIRIESTLLDDAGGVVGRLVMIPSN